MKWFDAFIILGQWKFQTTYLRLENTGAWKLSALLIRWFHEYFDTANLRNSMLLFTLTVQHKNEYIKSVLRKKFVVSKFVKLSRCELRLFFGSHAPRMSRCARVCMRTPNLKWSQFAPAPALQQFFNLFPSIFQTFSSNFSSFLWFGVFQNRKRCSKIE